MRTGLWLTDELRSAVRVALAATAGAALLASMPPRGYWVFLPVAVALLVVAVRGVRWRRRLLLGAVAGATYLGPGLFWLTSFNVFGYIGVLAVEVALLGIAMAVVPAYRSGWWAVPAALVLLEAVRSRFPFGGFPLPGLALGQVDGPFAGAARLGGSLLVVALAGAAGVAVVAPFVARRGLLSGAGTLVGVVTITVVTVLLPTHTTGHLDVALVQGGGPRGIPAVVSDANQVTERHLRESARITGNPDLVLWPEGVVDIEGPVLGSPQGDRLAALARRHDATLVVGVVEGEGDRFRNAAVAWNPDGSPSGRYEKVHRVPFGEYLPLRGLVERLTSDAALVPRDAIQGRRPGRLDTAAGRLGVVISYEVFFADRTRAAANAGGQVLLVPTNAASYTSDEVPAMEVAAARLRARELGQAVLQAAPTGYSAVIRPDGTVVRQSELEAPAVLEARVPLRDQRTPYTRTGDWPMLGAALLALLLTASWHLPTRRRRQRSEPVDAGKARRCQRPCRHQSPSPSA